MAYRVLIMLMLFSIASEIQAAYKREPILSARTAAMSNMVVMSAQDPSVVFFNPALLTQLPGTQFLLGVGSNIGTFEASENDVQIHESDSFIGGYSPHAYVTTHLKNLFSLGFGFYEMTHELIAFLDGESGFGAGYSELVLDSRRSRLTLAVGREFFSFLSLGINGHFQFGHRRVVAAAGNALIGSGWGFGGGVLINAPKAFPFILNTLSFAASYHSKMLENMDGRDVTALSPSPAWEGAELNWVTAQSVEFGIKCKPFSALSLHAGLNWIDLSQEGDITIADEVSGQSTIVREPQNISEYGGSAEYFFLNSFSLLLGYKYTPLALREEVVVSQSQSGQRFDIDNHLFSIGISKHFLSRGEVSLSYNNRMGKDRQASFSQTVIGPFFTAVLKSQEHIFAFDIKFEI